MLLGHERGCPTAGLELVTVPACPKPAAPTQGRGQRSSLQIRGECICWFILFQEKCLQNDDYLIGGVNEPFSFTQACAWPRGSDRDRDSDSEWLVGTKLCWQRRKDGHHTPSPGNSIPTGDFSLIVAYLGIFATPLPPSVLPLSDNGALIGNWQCLPGFWGAGSLNCAPLSWCSEVAALLPTDSRREH